MFLDPDTLLNAADPEHRDETRGSERRDRNRRFVHSARTRVAEVSPRPVYAEEEKTVCASGPIGQNPFAAQREVANHRQPARRPKNNRFIHEVKTRVASLDEAMTRGMIPGAKHPPIATDDEFTVAAPVDGVDFDFAPNLEFAPSLRDSDVPAAPGMFAMGSLSDGDEAESAKRAMQAAERAEHARMDRVRARAKHAEEEAMRALAAIEEAMEPSLAPHPYSVLNQRSEYRPPHYDEMVGQAAPQMRAAAPQVPAVASKAMPPLEPNASVPSQTLAPLTLDGSEDVPWFVKEQAPPAGAAPAAASERPKFPSQVPQTLMTIPPDQARDMAAAASAESQRDQAPARHVAQPLPHKAKSKGRLKRWLKGK